MSAYSDLILSRSPIAYWKFDETSGTTASDSSGNGYDLTYTNSPSLGQTGLTRTGNSVQFNGTDQSAVFADNTTPVGDSISGSGQVTIEAWIVPDIDHNGNIFSSPISDTGNTGFSIGLTPTNNISIGGRSVTGDSYQSVTYTKNIIGVISHVVGIIDYANDSLYLYLNGRLVASNTSATFTNTTYTNTTITNGNHDALGCQYNDSNYFYGTIDQVAIYDYALTQEQIIENFQAGSREFARVDSHIDGIKKDIIQQAKPLLYYKFDNQDYTGTSTVIDYSDYRDHSATITGSPTQSDPLVSSGKSLTFASGDYISLGDRPELNFGTKDWSIEFWFNYTDTAVSFPTIIGSGVTSFSNGALSIIYDNVSYTNVLRVSNFFNGGVSTTLNSATVRSNNTTYHAVLVKSKSSLSWYINGLLDGTTTTTDSFNLNANNNTIIGRSGWDGASSQFTGLLDNFAIYNRALGAKEIENNYFYGLYGKVVQRVFYPAYVVGSVAIYSYNEARVVNELDYIYCPQFVMPLNSGKWYFEATSISGTNHFIGISKNGAYGLWPSSNTFSLFANGNVYYTGVVGAAAAYVPGDTVGVLYDSDNYQVFFSVNGVMYGPFFTGTATHPTGFVPWFSNGSGGSGLGTAKFKIEAHELKHYPGGGAKLLYGKPPTEEKDHIQKLNPVAYWKLDEVSGTTAYDSSDNGYHLTYTNSPLVGQTGLTKTGNSVVFNGTNQYASRAEANFRSGDNQGSIECWFKTSGTTDNAAIFSSSDNAANTDTLMLYMNNNGTIRFANKTSDVWNQVSTTNTFSDNNLHHVVVTSDGSTYSIYVDGIKEALTITAGSNNGNWFSDLTNRDNVELGRLGQLTDLYYFDGTIDQVAIYDYPLSAEQIQQNYLNNAKLTYNYEQIIKNDAPVAYWKLDETSGTTAYDAVGSINGTYINAPLLDSPALIVTGSAVNFNTASSEYIKIGSTGELPVRALLDGRSQITAEAWIQFSVASPASNGSVFSITIDGTVTGVGITHLANGNIEVSSRSQTGDANQSITVSASSYVNKIVHIVNVIDYSASEMKMYINGQLVSTLSATYGSSTFNPSGGALSSDCIGASFSESFSFNGTIDEVAVYDYALSIAQIQSHYQAGSWYLQEPDDYEWTIKKKHPVAYWKLDETSGTTAYDAVGSVDGTYVNTPTLNQIGLVTTGKSVLFNGSTNDINVGNNFKFLNTDIFSIEAWVKVSASGNNSIFCSINDSFIGYLFEVNPSFGIRFLWRHTLTTNQLDVSTDNSLVVLNDIAHIVLTYDGSSSAYGVNVFIDGVKMPITASTDNLSATPTYTVDTRIGSRNSTSAFFNGAIDEVAIYDYALTPYQILENYEVGKGTKFVELDTNEEPDNYYV